MEKTRKWKITLSDGTKIENLRLNGNNFVSEVEITEETFRGKLSKVSFEGEVNGAPFKQECNQMELVQIARYKDGYYFVLREITQEELDKIKTRADIEYLAMMANIDMEEE
ncbi:MAG: hypothetical protein HFJ54_07265 [Clostridia bacterium]|nr:hypothetical protein [Clostridia bacterium]